MSGLKLNMIPQIMAFYTESKMRWKMERMVSTVKVSWLQEAQFAVSLIVRFEVLFSDVTVTLFLGIKIKLVLSLECFGISQGETCSPALSSRNPVELLQNISGYSLWERCCCLSVFVSPGDENSWSEEGVGPRIISPTQVLLYCPAGRVHSSDGGLFQVIGTFQVCQSFQIDVFLMNLCSWQHLTQCSKTLYK